MKTNSPQADIRLAAPPATADELKDWLIDQRCYLNFCIDFEGGATCRIWIKEREYPGKSRSIFASDSFASMLWAAMADAGLQGEFLEWWNIEKWRREPKWSNFITTDANGHVFRWSDEPSPSETVWLVTDESRARYEIVSRSKEPCPHWRETLEARPLTDDAAMKQFVEEGTKAWADLPDAAAWVSELRGHDEARPDGKGEG